MKTYQYYAGGVWRDAENGRTFDDLEPYSGKIYAKVAAGSRKDMNIALTAAAEAFPAWAATTPAQRSELLFKAASIIKRRRSEIAGILAKETGKHTQLASLELAIENGETAGACDVGFACPYTNTISWKSANTPLVTQNNPRIVFERLFGDTANTDPKSRLNRIQQQRSVLDSLTKEVAQLQGSLGRGDRNKLIEYFESIRDVERRIQVAEEQNDQNLPVVDHPVGIPATYDEHVKLMCDLQVLAYQCDLTRVITLMLGREFSGVTYPQVGVPDAHHPITHHAGEPEKIAKVEKINAYHVTQFTYLLEKMRTTSDGDGSLLDHATLIYGTGMGECNAHDPRNIPLLIAGGGCGTIKGGQHIRYPKETPLANLHLTLLANFGIKWERIGDSTGPLELPS